MNNLRPDLLADINAVQNIPAIPNILEVICKSTGMGFAAVARVTSEQWIACSVNDKINFGLQPGGQLVLETTICNEIRQNDKAIIINHVSQDAEFCNHHTPKMYGFESYVSIPIYRKDGAFFGTLCAIDPKPAQLDKTQVFEMFSLYADLISFYLSAAQQVDTSQKELAEERKIAELRDQFIAILGHDLRNPLGAITSSAQLMLKMPLDDRLTKLARIVKNSSYRINGLIENVLDFARGRLGEGITLEMQMEYLEDPLNQVITELQTSWPECQINFEAHLKTPVNCDARRISQLFSNLLGNALTHGDKTAPIDVLADSREGSFMLSVTNRGSKIPDAALKQLFQPFSRGKVKKDQQGLGLGLYIASQIAIAHGGILSVDSTDEQTSFSFKLPA
ncbi:GAF domain-containing sensor histidine kinase [Pedobacter sp. SAFR-022]|uniref:GAF domain-containing sensor histidine kinase n=1 Tax=Pedobacter sp. SAFR-022 TaxID=3436861 RepID=UPI003F7E1960